MKKLIALLSILLVTSPIVLAEEEITLPTDVQKVNVKNSYLTGVLVDNTKAEVQQVNVTNSFLVFIKIKASDNYKGN